MLLKLLSVEVVNLFTVLDVNSILDSFLFILLSILCKFLISWIKLLSISVGLLKLNLLIDKLFTL